MFNIYDYPYSSQRMPVLAKNMVATSQPLAAQAGLNMLNKGGNAVDAAIATAITLTVVEPTSNGIGSDAFAIIYDGDKLYGLNASGRSPQNWTYKYFTDKYDTMPKFGWDSVTVPGAVSSWVELSKRFGKLSFEDLFEYAIHYAENGFMVSPITAMAWNRAAKIFKDNDDFNRAFLNNGKAPQAGEKFIFEEQGKTLKEIAKTGGESFYRGELAEKIIKHSNNCGGKMTPKDLANHKPSWVDTISMDYSKHTLNEIPPNGQGIAALIMLGIVKEHDIRQYPLDSADSLHLQIEAMKLAFADVHRYVSDPETMDITSSDLLNPTYLKERAKLIDMNKAKNPDYGLPKGQDTVYLTTADESGMMVSFIQSNYYGFGSGIVIPDTGISMQNRGFGFTLNKGMPNCVDGGKLPYHTIIPAFVTSGIKPVMSFGVMGGPMQPQGHSQMMIRIFDYNQNPQTASDAPRWQVMGGLDVGFEKGFDNKVIEELKNRGHYIKIAEYPIFGGAQLIYKLDDGYLGATDKRKDGQAIDY